MVLPVELFKACCGSVAKITGFAALDPMAGTASKNTFEYLARYNVSAEDLQLMYWAALQRAPYMLELSLQDFENIEKKLTPIAIEGKIDVRILQNKIIQVCQKLRTPEVVDELGTGFDAPQIQNAFLEVTLGKEIFSIPDTFVFYLNKITGFDPSDASFNFLVQKGVLFHTIDYQFRLILLNDARMKVLNTFNSYTKMKLRLNLLGKQITAKEKQRVQIASSNEKEAKILAEEIIYYQNALKKMTIFVEDQKNVLETLQSIADTLEHQTSTDILDKVKDLPLQQNKVKKDSSEGGEVSDSVEEVSRLTKQAMEFLGADRIEFSHSLLGPILEKEKPKIEKARTVFEKIPNTYTQKPFFANRLGVILNAIGYPDKAAEYFRRALVLLPNSNKQERGPIESNLFHALLNRGSFDAALRYMLESLEAGSEECNLFDVERYVPQKILGVGGMGVTFLCNDLYEERKSVVKTLWRYATGGLKETFAEAFMAKKVDDPRIIKIYDIGRHRANRPFIVMEFCSGIDLQRYIQEVKQGKPLDISEALTIILEVAKGLAVAHKQNPPIIHRDIKPNNILYSPEKQTVKIIDFGIACMLPNPEEISRSITRSTASVIAKNIAGTWGYMSPEQQRGDTELTARCDIFSMGKTLMFLLTGKTPPPENIFALNPQVRETIGELVGYCLMPHAEERYTAEQAISKIQEIKERLQRKNSMASFNSATVVEDSNTSVSSSFPLPPLDIIEELAPLEASEVEDAIEAIPEESSHSNKDIDDVQVEEIQEDNLASEPEQGFGLEEIMQVNKNTPKIPSAMPVDISAKAAPPSAKAAPPSAKAVPPSAKAAPPFAKAAPPSAKAAPPSAKAAQSESNDGMEALFDSADLVAAEEETTSPSMEIQLDADALTQEATTLKYPNGNFDLSGGMDLEEPPQQMSIPQNLQENEESQENDSQENFEQMSESSDEANFDEQPMSNVLYDLPEETVPAEAASEVSESTEAEEPAEANVAEDDFDEAGEYLRPKKPLPKIDLPAGYKWDGNIVICEKDGATMFYIPPGVFTMGYLGEDGATPESPEHDVNLDGYLIDECPVTWYQYNIFCDETKRKKPPQECWEMDESQPVVNVSFDDAQAYASWAIKSLPTEAQWEKAAKGGHFFDGDTNMMLKNKEPKRRYPWGNDFPNTNDEWFANCLGEPKYGCRMPSPVGSFPKGSSPYGCLDMAGNIWEWCLDWYDENYYKTSPASNPRGPKTGKGRVLRGGCWNSEVDKITTTFRCWMEPDLWWNIVGFRTVKNFMITKSKGE